MAEQPDAWLEEDFAEIQRASELIDVERLRRLAEIDRRGTFRRDGHLSAASWLASTFKVAWGTARNEVRMARALEDLDGRRPPGGRVLAPGRERGGRHGRGGAAPGAAEAPRLGDVHGMVRVDGDLDPETGETLLTALRAVLDAESRTKGTDDGRTPAQRRADALGQVCRQWLDLGDRPTVAGERPHVTVTVGTDALGGGESAGAPGSTSELDHAGPVDPALARRIACDGSIRRVVLAGRSEPLDVGRRTPVVSPALRRAVIVRDRGCRFPGCDRPHSWCDAHHVVHWADAGPTAPANLVLLCRRHHRMIHSRGGFRLALEDGRPVFRRPENGAGGSGPAVAAASRPRLPSGVRSGGSARPRTPWGAHG